MIVLGNNNYNAGGCGCGARPMAGDHRTVMVPPLGDNPPSFGRQFGTLVAIIFFGGLAMVLLPDPKSKYKDVEFDD